jgi:hypothetical protein
MEVANGGSERPICEIFLWDCPFCVWMSSPPEERCVYDQEAHVPSLSEMWTGVRIFLGTHALRANVSYFAQTQSLMLVILIPLNV